MKRIVSSLKFVACVAVVAVTSLACPSTADAVVISDGRLDAASPQNPMGLRPGCHFQVHSVRLTAGTTYTIDLTSTQVDPYLIMSGHGVLIQDDDSGGNLNARIVFNPTVTGDYNFYATTFARGERGNYRISVVP